MKGSNEDHLRKTWNESHETKKGLNELKDTVKEFRAEGQAQAEKFQKEKRRLATSLQRSNDQIKELAVLTKKLEEKNGSLKEDERENTFIKINEEIRMLKALNSSLEQEVETVMEEMEDIEARLTYLEQRQRSGIPVDVSGKSQISFCSLYRSSNIMSLSLFKITLENECYHLAFNKSLIFFVAI